MTDLTVDPQIRIEARPDIVYISTAEALMLICPICGNTRNVYLHHPPTAEEMHPNGTLHTGSSPYSPFKMCRCIAGSNAGDEYRLLTSIHQAVSTCRTVGEVQRMLQSMTAQAEMEVSHNGR